jgi:PAS domain S-box-containing protein
MVPTERPFRPSRGGRSSVLPRGRPPRKKIRAWLETVFQASREAHLLITPDGQVRLMNEQAEEILGVNQHLAFGRDLFSEQRDASFVSRWQTFLAGGEDVLRVELRRDGSESRSYVVTLSRVRTDEGRLAG